LNFEIEVNRTHGKEKT